jgi:hypothetical protein
VSNAPVDPSFEAAFSSALHYGISNLKLALAEKAQQFDTSIDKWNYLTEVISYDLSKDKRKAMKMFLELIS